MKSTISYLIEPFLTQFFLVDAICQGFIDEEERRTIFNELANVFCVPINEETEEFYKTLNFEEYKRINDYPAYERLCRTVEFAQSSGHNVAITEVDRIIMAQKREAMLAKSEIFKQGKNLTRDIIADTLLETSMNGNVDAMATLAYMEYHGICVCKDKKHALKRISLCARWNNLFGNLMGIKYDAENKGNYYDTLYTILRSSNQKAVFNYICEFTSYNTLCKRKPVARIIEKAFGLNIVKRNTYDQIFAKVAFSQLISDEDKEKLLLNKKDEAIVSLSVIPFDVDRTSAFLFDEKAASKMTLNREKELSEIFCSISPAVNNRLDLYRTLFVVGSDDYISDMYVDTLKKGFEGKNPVVEIDASMLTMQDFVGAKENFILRGLSETKKTHTVFLVKNCNEMGENELMELVKLLDYDYRRKFKLLEPTVSLNLSDVLIILFASECNDAVCYLSEECDMVWTDKIDADEKKVFIDSVFKTRSKSFGCGKVKLEANGKEYLTSFGTGQIIRLIDGALKKVSYEKENTVNAETLRNISDQQNIHRSKREFGYFGGNYNEKN